MFNAIGLKSPFVIRSRGFNPSTLFALAEPGVWYDPSDLTTLFQDTAGTTPVTTPGQTVARIDDKSGNGLNATQATAASRPTYQVDGNGKAYLSFDGVDDFLVTPTITPGIDKAQVFAGVRKLSDAATGMLTEFSAAALSNPGSFFLASPSSTTQEFAFLSGGSRRQADTTAVLDNAAFVSPVSAVITATGDISQKQTVIRGNGVVYATATGDQGTGNFLAYPLYIGRRGGTSLPFNGRIYGLIARFGANLDANTISNTETWVNSKTGAY